MTTVPVLWTSLHVKDGVLPRGDKADQALLEAIFDRSLWRPPGALTFEHHEVGLKGWPQLNGAVVVIPARDHVGDESTLLAHLEAFDWAVVMLTSMEEWDTFDWAPFAEQWPTWVWQGVPGQYEAGCRLVPCGWYPGTREGLIAGDMSPAELAGRIQPEVRDLDWYFAGQITHQRRQEAALAMKGLVTKGENFAKGRFVETDGYMVERDRKDKYLATLARTKLVPCPSGPESLCTARVEEALEAGCVPILDLVKPGDDVHQFDYWSMLFGPDHPCPTIIDWNDLPDIVERELDDWPANANRCWAMWQQWKRAATHRLDLDVRQAADLEAGWQAGTPDDLITVIIPTSPVPLHPSTEHIEETIDSVREQLPDAEIIVGCDGVRREQEHLAESYAAYLHRLLWLTNFRWRNVVPILLDDWVHQAGVVRRSLQEVTTPLVLFVEHDTPLVGPIDWPKLCDLVGSGEANAVQFREDVEINEAHEPLMLDHTTRFVRGVQVRRTADWRQRPHLAQTRFYRERIMPGFTEESRAMVEDTFYGVVKNRYDLYGEAGWYDFRVWAYCPGQATDPPLGFKRHRHIDSRGDEPKGSTDILPLEGFS